MLHDAGGHLNKITNNRILALEGYSNSQLIFAATPNKIQQFPPSVSQIESKKKRLRRFTKVKFIYYYLLDDYYVFKLNDILKKI